MGHMSYSVSEFFFVFFWGVFSMVSPTFWWSHLDFFGYFEFLVGLAYIPLSTPNYVYV